MSKEELIYQDIEHTLIELIADVLDEDSIVINEELARIKDPVNREESELHIRMAKAAMLEYRKTMKDY